MIRILSLAILAGLMAAIGGTVSPAPACAPAPAPGQSVDIAEESALIVWDEANKTEHFLRQARFQSTSPDFGFLVPTPSVPTLSESNAAVFDSLAAITAPKVEMRIVKKPRERMPSGHASAIPKDAAEKKSAVPPRGVEVLAQNDIGGYEATVLKFHRGPANDLAADAKELGEWLNKRGYEFGPQLTDWLKPYIANGWVITAFRVARPVPVSFTTEVPPQPRTQELNLKPIWMSFKTEKPFYPYREPEAQKDKKPANGDSTRLLRVFVIARERFGGTLGTGTTAWVGQTVWSDKAEAGQLKDAAEVGKLPRGAVGETAWITEFEDRSSPRNGVDEVYFSPAADKTAVHRPPIIHEIVEYYDEPNGTPVFMQIAIVVGLVILAIAFAFYIVLIFRTPKERPQ